MSQKSAEDDFGNVGFGVPLHVPVQSDLLQHFIHQFKIHLSAKFRGGKKTHLAFE